MTYDVLLRKTGAILLGTLFVFCAMYVSSDVADASDDAAAANEEPLIIMITDGAVVSPEVPMPELFEWDRTNHVLTLKGGDYCMVECDSDDADKGALWDLGVKIAGDCRMLAADMSGEKMGGCIATSHILRLTGEGSLFCNGTVGIYAGGLIIDGLKSLTIESDYCGITCGSLKISNEYVNSDIEILNCSSVDIKVTNDVMGAIVRSVGGSVTIDNSHLTSTDEMF